MIALFTGLLAGILHVWSGPDHLAALAPLAVRRPAKAWAPGARWGVGHSAGVALIGLLSLWLRDLIPVNLLSTWGERMVGLMLIGIGFWAWRKALRVHAHEHEHDGERHLHMHAHSHQSQHEKPEAHHQHTHAAFGIGILHGLAGSSHFLGVLPVLAFPTRAEALGYLLTFAIGTIISMATFSSIMGLVAARWATGSTKFYRGLMSTCAIAAMGVGCFWLFSS
ncbi:MAG TPA: sulfite exporter TauE/SafE family protein [Candidatus Dormibacteraeota bacterium]|nr:sulfite exporter TauE/SafE family protein [Candidatus Dormibacteraeota bacterium]